MVMNSEYKPPPSKLEISANKQIVLFYFAIALASTALLTLSLGRAQLLGATGFAFLFKRSFEALMDKLFRIKMKYPPTTFGIETGRFLNTFSIVAALSTGISLSLSSSKFFIGFSFFMLLLGIELSFHTRLKKSNDSPSHHQKRNT
jgi:hypothetical protein